MEEKMLKNVVRPNPNLVLPEIPKPEKKELTPQDLKQIEDAKPKKRLVNKRDGS
jgi:hypothetical protein